MIVFNSTKSEKRRNENIFVRFLYFMCSSLPFEVDCDKLKMCAINSKSTINITQQRVIANKTTKEIKGIIKHTQL